MPAAARPVPRRRFGLGWGSRMGWGRRHASVSFSSGVNSTPGVCTPRLRDDATRRVPQGCAGSPAGGDPAGMGPPGPCCPPHPRPRTAWRTPAMRQRPQSSPQCVWRLSASQASAGHASRCGHTARCTWVTQQLPRHCVDRPRTFRVSDGELFGVLAGSQSVQWVSAMGMRVLLPHQCSVSVWDHVCVQRLREEKGHSPRVLTYTFSCRRVTGRLSQWYGLSYHCFVDHAQGPFAQP